MLKAFNNDFINEMKDKYNDFKDKTNAQIFYDWVNSFKYEFGNLFPEPESITIDNNTKKLDNLLKLKELGANIADIEAELNEDEIFKNEMDLDGEQPDFTEGEQSLYGDDNLDNDNIDNKIDYNMCRFVEADAKKDFNENDVKRDKDGKFAKKNESGDGDNDKKDNSKDADNENGNSKKYINKCIRSLPKHLQPIGKRLYSGEYGGGELVYKSKYSPIGGNHIDQDKLDNLSETEYSIFAFTEDGRSSSGWEERDNSDIIELIQKAPLKREALFRGEPENNIGELEVGKVINFDNKIRSFTNTEDGESIAKGFAFKYNTKKEGVRPVVYKINKPVHALCVNPLSYYQSQEDEHLCYGSFKITKILPKKNFDFIIIEPLE